jgi:predicted MFS family arabinose efflux permease
MFVSYLDRFVLAIFVQPIKAELGLTDGQIGLLTGFAFSAVYALGGLPLARIADTSSRKIVLCGALAVWSAMTALCGCVQGFWQLFLARMGVGAGEAGGVPASHAMISDMFPPERRAMAMSIFTAGGAAGILGGFAIGGWLEAAFGWRGAFLLLGVPGLVLAILIGLTLREPVRGQSGAAHLAAKTARGAPYAALLGNPLVRYLLLAQALSNLLTFSQLQWMPAFFERTFSLPRPEIGEMIALTRGVGMVAGLLAGGMLADRLSRRNGAWPLGVVLIAQALALLPNLGLYIARDANTAFALTAVAGFLSAAAMGPEVAILQGSAPPHQRATISSMSMVCSGLIGVGAGPWLVGLLSDALAGRHGDDSLRTALLIVIAVASPLTLGAYGLALWELRRRLGPRRDALSLPPADQPATPAP